MKYFTVFMGVLLLTGFVLAADFNGKWAGEITGASMQIEFKFKADGNTLTGFHVMNGTETAITEGKIDGDKISFKVALEGMGTFEHKGTLSGDQIKMTYDNGSGMTGEISVKKSK